MLALSLLFGAIVGFSLGLTGGGGSIFAVPLLVYGLSVPAREATGLSLAAVGATAFAGFLQRLRRHDVEIGAGLFFSAAGMIAAPAGSWLAGKISPATLLTLFSALMLVVAASMWRKASTRPADAAEVRADIMHGDAESPGPGPACERDPAGGLRMNSRCAVRVAGAGLVAGILSGFFGVGGGFIIVPALVLFTGMGIHRAVGTSLLAIALISSSGVISHLLGHRAFALDLALLFVAGGVAGMVIGTRVGRRLSGPRLQKVFAVAIVLMAVYMAARTLLAPPR